MTFFWLYSFPNWLLLILFITFFSSFGIIGFLATEAPIKRWLGHSPAENNIVANFLSIIGVFYGFTLGLIAVGTWNNYCKAQDMISKEATALEALYMNAAYLSSPYRQTIQDDVREITRYIIYEAWPLQQKGMIPRKDNIQKLQKDIFSVKPSSELDQINLSNLIQLFNNTYDLRKQRLESISAGLPKELYWVLFIGAFINICTTWLLVAKRKSLHVITTAMTGVLIGSLIFLIFVMDYPFRGDIDCINPGSYQIAYSRMTDTAQGK